MASVTEVLVAVLFCLLIVIDVVGNALVCLVVYRIKQMQRPMNYLLVNLAVADVVIGLFMLPRHVFHIAFKHPTGSSGNVLCKFITGGAFIWLSAAAAALLLIAIAAERYFAIVHPLRNKYRLNKKRVVVITAFSWGFACLLSAPSMAAISYDQERDFCVEKWPDWYPEKGHVCFVFFVNCVLSIVSMTFLYFKVIYKLWSNSPTATSSVQAARLKARKRVTVMLVVVTLTHTLCWTPNYVLYLLIFFVPGLSYGSTKYIITVLLILLNAAVDPLLYTWYMDGFKRGIQNMLCRHINRNRVRRVGDTAGQYFVETPVGLMFSTTMEPNHIINT